MDELHYKNALVTISDFLVTTKKSIRDIPLIEYQQRIGTQVDNIGNKNRRQQDRTLAIIQVKTYRGKIIDDLEWGYN